MFVYLYIQYKYIRIQIKKIVLIYKRVCLDLKININILKDTVIFYNIFIDLI